MKSPIAKYRASICDTIAYFGTIALSRPDKPNEAGESTCGQKKKR